VPLTVIYDAGFSLLSWANQLVGLARPPLIASVSYGNPNPDPTPHPSPSPLNFTLTLTLTLTLNLLPPLTLTRNLSLTSKP
jgi:hypothetical protein